MSEEKNYLATGHYGPGDLSSLPRCSLNEESKMILNYCSVQSSSPLFLGGSVDLALRRSQVPIDVRRYFQGAIVDLLASGLEIQTSASVRGHQTNQPAGFLLFIGQLYIIF